MLVFKIAFHIRNINIVPRLEIVNNGFCHKRLKNKFIRKCRFYIGIHPMVDSLYGMAIQKVVFPKQFAHSLQRLHTRNHIRNLAFSFEHRVLFRTTQQRINGGFQNVGKVRVTPAAWKNEVMTCYLKTAVPVELSGVTWIYGAPTMAAGYIYVIAMQQIDAATVLANLAYVLPQ